MKKIVLIVGASGVGKDTLIKALQNRVEANFIRRYITREPDNNESNHYIDEEAFELLKKEGFFISSWSAHYNMYGIPKNRIQEGLNIISVSRNAIKDFENAFDNVVTIHITINKEKLIERLILRGRETKEQIEQRLQRASMEVKAQRVIEFDNSSSLEESVEKFVNILKIIQNEK